MLIKILIMVGVILITLIAIAGVSTTLTFVQLLKEQKSINAIELDIKTLQAEINLRKKECKDDKMGNACS